MHKWIECSYIEYNLSQRLVSIWLSVVSSLKVCFILTQMKIDNYCLLNIFKAMFFSILLRSRHKRFSFWPPHQPASHCNLSFSSFPLVFTFFFFGLNQCFSAIQTSEWVYCKFCLSANVSIHLVNKMFASFSFLSPSLSLRSVCCVCKDVFVELSVLNVEFV